CRRAGSSRRHIRKSETITGLLGSTAPMIVSETVTLRSNPGYEAVPLNRLTPAERQSLTAAQPDVASGADCYGVLVPSPGSSLMPVVICRETALLFLTLQSPGP